MSELFDMSEPHPIRLLRSKLKLALAAMAERVGISSIGHMSDIERGAPCSVAVALRIEALSDGTINAASLSNDVALVDAARDRRWASEASSEEIAA